MAGHGRRFKNDERREGKGSKTIRNKGGQTRTRASKQMRNTVYVLGAGLNQAVRDWHSLSPPMLRNFFQILLKNPALSSAQSLRELQPLFSYIERYWKKSEADLATSGFDLEEVFTLLESQRQDAFSSKDEAKARELASIEYLLTSLLAEVLSEFEVFSVQSDAMRAFGEILYSEKPTIITFNYDTITEAVIESASGLRGRYPASMRLPPNQRREITDEEVSFSHHNWNRPLGYGIKFDLVQLHRAGISAYVEGNRFYANSENSLYDWPILKLHGSLNWFRFLPIRSLPLYDKETGRPLFDEDAQQPQWMKNAVIHVETHWWMHRAPDLEGWFIDPLIMTPVLNKERLFDESLYGRVFAPLWTAALESLSHCKRLVIVGYSFSPTDFRTKKLFLEAFESNQLEQLVVVNPDPTVAEKAAELCHFKGPEVFQDLKSFITSVHQAKPDQFSGYESSEELAQRFVEGERLLRSLDEAHFETSSAFWFLLPKPSGWRLFLASPAADSLGGEEAMTNVGRALSSLSPPSTLNRAEIAIVSPNHSLIILLRKLVRTGPTIGGIRFRDSLVDDFKIQDAYVYRMQ